MGLRDVMSFEDGMLMHQTYANHAFQLGQAYKLSFEANQSNQSAADAAIRFLRTAEACQADRELKDQQHDLCLLAGFSLVSLYVDLNRVEEARKKYLELQRHYQRLKEAEVTLTLGRSIYQQKFLLAKATIYRAAGCPKAAVKACLLYTSPSPRDS
eukprot:TRINITY_DN14773_c0_g1_i1.p1 TRINITY_DN14773_c0_g1~~TRINITY_DN14773_c0_g1_i1.p1  ORF type:complete len:156 (-),score=34.01 TRINITY_DN14773_c0_g1_i1:34-501(-)